MGTQVDKTIYQRPEQLLQQLIRFDTTNPPGNEKACVEYIASVLEAAGIESKLYAKDPNRPNLVARLKGRSADVPPLLLYGHVDVVPTDEKGWAHPPFSGDISEGCVWGRGALDMKGAVAMMVSAFMKAEIEKTQLPGDVILCILSDEEMHGDFGAGFMTEKHKELFKGVKYALGEFGGFTLFIQGKKFYLIEIAQRQRCGIKAIVRGKGGHAGAAVVQGETMARLARLLKQLDKNLLPVHVTPEAEMMFNAIADRIPGKTGNILRGLTKPGWTDFIFKRILKEKGRVFLPIFRNTVNATIVKASDKLNVIPDEAEVHLDVRLLPGFDPEDVVKELRPILGKDVELEFMFYDENPQTLDMGMFDKLAGILKEADPEGIPVPMLLPGTSDARFFSRLGIQTYGFVPMQLPEELNFNSLIHAVNERIPVDTMVFGADAFHKAIQSFG